MKKIIILLIAFVALSAYGIDDKVLINEQTKQSYINDIGLNILNKNKINKKIVFSYNKNEYKKTINDPTLTKRQIIFYEQYFKYIENDDEMAAFLSQEISKAYKSYTGEWGGLVSSLQVKAAPKKHEVFAQKRAVDLMVKANYNPLGLITYIQKSAPQGLLDKILFHNPPSKSQAIIYEYIYFNYPEFLKNNVYLNNKAYQNFLLTSFENRKKLQEKIENNSKKEIKYE